VTSYGVAKALRPVNLQAMQTADSTTKDDDRGPSR
jgi:hypothetical protein